MFKKRGIRMKKMFLLFSHTLTSAQSKDAEKNFDINECVVLPKRLQELWSNIPPELESIEAYLEPLKNYLLSNASNGDAILIQGDFGGGYHMVNFAKEHNFLALYATTKRDVQERAEGNVIVKKSVFKHIRFREYM